MNNVEKLLQYTYSEMYINGYQAANTTKILENSGINKGTMYHYFKNKEDLALRVLDEILKPKVAALYNCEERVINKDNLIKLISSTDLIAQKHGSMLVNLTAEMSGIDEAFREKLGEINMIRVECITTYLDTIFVGKDNTNMAKFIISAIDGGVLAYKRSLNIQDFYNMVRNVEDYLNRC